MSKRNREERRRQREAEANDKSNEVQRLPNPQAPSRPGMTLQVRTHSGPLPDPDTLQQYDRVAPGAAQRIIAMGEREQRHRHRIAVAEQVNSLLGVVSAFLIAMAFLAGSVYLGIHGQPELGGVLGGGTLVSIVTVFLKARQTVSQPGTDRNGPQKQG